MSDDIERRDADSRIWVLGAPDPEMEMIERTLRECGERVAYALDERGERVTPATAYRCPVPAPEGATVYAVECIDVLPDGWVRIDHHRPGDPGYGRPPSEFLAASSLGQVIAELARLGRLPGPLVSSYEWVGDWEEEKRAAFRWFHWETEARTAFSGGALFERFRTPYRISPCDGYYILARRVSGVVEFAASPDEMRDAGAVRVAPDKIVRVHIPHDLVLAAAADHCLGAAYRGECPGVDPDALMRWRAESRARFQGRTVEEVLADVERAQAALRAAPELVLSEHICEWHLGRPGSGGDCVNEAGTAYSEDPCSAVVVRDMRQPVDQLPTRELPEAATRLGIGYVSGPLVGPDGRQKITCSGTADQVRAFLDHWAPSQGLVDAYGDPQRGFAGAYLREEVES